MLVLCVAFVSVQFAAYCVNTDKSVLPSPDLTVF